jgi:uncharacterized membrane protein
VISRIFKYIKTNRLKIILYAVTVVTSAVLLFVGHKTVYDKETVFLGGYDDGASKGTVTEVVSQDITEHTVDGEVIGSDIRIVFKCRVTEGELKGQTVEALESISAFDAVKLDPVEVGDKVLIIEAIDEECDWYLYDYDRSLPLWILGLAFVALVLLFGRKKGVNTIISLGFTCAAVFAVFVPSVLSGQNIYLWSIITCVYIIAMTLTVTEGYSKKTLAAVIGCASGVVVAGVLTVVTSHFLNMSGVTGDESINLIMNFDIDLNALIFAGIILGAVGAVMDVSVSISSSLKEIHDQVENPTFGGLVKSGINIGRDIMGTMANTLVLAYIGCELSATLLQVMYSSSMSTLFSREKIVAELLQALVGSIGILLTIPLTAVVSAALYTGFKRKADRTKAPKEKHDKYYIEPAEEPSLFEKTEED